MSYTKTTRARKARRYHALTEQTGAARNDLARCLEALAAAATHQATRLRIGDTFQPDELLRRLEPVKDTHRILLATLQAFEATETVGHGIITGSHVDRDTT